MLWIESIGQYIRVVIFVTSMVIPEQRGQCYRSPFSGHCTVMTNGQVDKQTNGRLELSGACVAFLPRLRASSTRPVRSDVFRWRFSSSSGGNSSSWRRRTAPRLNYSQSSASFSATSSSTVDTSPLSTAGQLQDHRYSSVRPLQLISPGHSTPVAAH